MMTKTLETIVRAREHDLGKLRRAGNWLVTQMWRYGADEALVTRQAIMGLFQVSERVATARLRLLESAWDGLLNVDAVGGECFKYVNVTRCLDATSRAFELRQCRDGNERRGAQFALHVRSFPGDDWLVAYFGQVLAGVKQTVCGGGRLSVIGYGGENGARHLCDTDGVDDETVAPRGRRLFGVKKRTSTTT